MLPNLLRLIPNTPSSPSPEDILSSSLSTLFPDDCQVQYGDADTKILYRSARYGDLEFCCADVEVEEERTKFAHYLWNAGVLMAEVVGGAGGRPLEKEDWGRRVFRGGREWWLDVGEERTWAVKGHRVLELGAGVGLAGIVSVLAGAEEVALTDYPSLTLLDTIRTNAYKNISTPLPPHVTVQPHLWGDLSSSLAKSRARQYTRVLTADTLWLESQHANLAASMAHFLSVDADARVLMIAGFHTGRPKVASFFDGIGRVGLEIDTIWETDSNGERRAWDPKRPQGPGEDKRWLVVAALKRKCEEYEAKEVDHL